AYPGARLATESRASRTRPLVAEAYYGPRPIRDRITPIPDPWGGSRAARPRRPGRIAPAASRSSACHARLEQDHPTRVPIRITLRAESPGPQLDQGDLRRRADPDRRAPRPRPSGDVHLSPAAPGPGEGGQAGHHRLLQRHEQVERGELPAVGVAGELEVQ